jgi:hypothetical protein
MRLSGSAAGVILAGIKTGGVGLYAKCGGFPLGAGGHSLGWLEDTFHRQPILVMGINPWGNSTKVEPDIIGLMGVLAAQTSP